MTRWYTNGVAISADTEKRAYDHVGHEIRIDAEGEPRNQKRYAVLSLGVDEIRPTDRAEKEIEEEAHRPRFYAPPA